MLLDSWFDSSAASQPRHRDGRFAPTRGSQPEVSLNDDSLVYGVPERDVLRYAVVTHGARWASTAQRKQVIADHAPEFVVAVTSASAHSYQRHPKNSDHQRWCTEPTRTIPELAKVLIHEEEPVYYLSVLSRRDIHPAMAHYAAHHSDATVARSAIQHNSMTMNALLAVHARYLRNADRAETRRRVERFAPAQEHWAWLHEREMATAALAEQRLLRG